MNKRELADFLRGRREALRPRDVGLPGGGGRRRTPGLRREEVAWLAGVSTNYYERLEQARGPRPSSQVVAALGRALQLSDAELAHAMVLAGQAPSVRGGPPEAVSAGVRQLLDRLGPIPAYVLNAKHDVLAWNEMAVKLVVDFALLPAGERNVLRLSFHHDLCESSVDDEFVRQAAADLRQAAARYPSNGEITELIRELIAVSPDFAVGWNAHDVRGPQTMRKRIKHPEFGRLDLDCQVLQVPGEDQRIVMYTAEPGSAEEDVLERLRLGVPAHSTMTTS